MSNKHTSEQLYKGYCQARDDKNKALMQSYKLLLERRAAIGSSEARKWLKRIG